MLTVLVTKHAIVSSHAKSAEEERSEAQRESLELLAAIVPWACEAIVEAGQQPPRASTDPAVYLVCGQQVLIVAFSPTCGLGVRIVPAIVPGRAAPPAGPPPSSGL